MRRAALLSLLVAGLLPAPADAARWRHPWRGVTVDVPAGWQVTARSPQRISEPAAVLVATSFAHRRLPVVDGPCLPQVVAAARRAGGVALVLQEQQDRRFVMRFPPRPARFGVDRARAADPCLGQWILFRDGGRAFYLSLYAGRHASRRQVAAIERVASSLRIRSRTTTG